MADEWKPRPEQVAHWRAEYEAREAQLARLVNLHDTASREQRIVGGASLAVWAFDRSDGESVRSGRTDPDRATLLEVLGLVPKARQSADSDEQWLISGARRRGATWQEIGEALGYKPSGARQAARQRYARLGGRPAELDKQVAEAEAAGGASDGPA